MKTARPPDSHKIAEAAGLIKAAWGTRRGGFAPGRADAAAEAAPGGRLCRLGTLSVFFTPDGSERVHEPEGGLDGRARSRPGRSLHGPDAPARADGPVPDLLRGAGDRVPRGGRHLRDDPLGPAARLCAAFP